MTTAEQRCCCFSAAFTTRFLTWDAWNPFTGPKWNVNKLRTQMIGDIILCGLCFVISEAILMIEARYWRPVWWGLYWIAIQVIVGTIGIVGCLKRSPGYWIVFIVLTIMFAAINIAHTNQMRGEVVRSCNLAQISFKDCNPAHNAKAATHLSNCIFKNKCLAEQLEDTDCMAPGSKHCEDLTNMSWFFFINSVLNFLSYAEPCFWAVLLIIRAEITNDTCPDEPREAEEYPHPDFPQLFGDAEESFPPLISESK